MCVYRISFFRTQGSCTLKFWIGINGVVYLFFQIPPYERHPFARVPSILWVLSEIFPASSGIWLYKEQGGHFLIITLACSKVIGKIFLSNVLGFLFCFVFWDRVSFQLFLNNPISLLLLGFYLCQFSIPLLLIPWLAGLWCLLITSSSFLPKFILPVFPSAYPPIHSSQAIGCSGLRQIFTASQS